MKTIIAFLLSPFCRREYTRLDGFGFYKEDCWDAMKRIREAL